MATDYAPYDLLESQDPEDIQSMMFLNLIRQRRYLQETEAAYNGAYNNGWATEDFNRAFRHLQGFTDNFLRMIVESYVSRLIIQGFTVGKETEESLVSPGEEMAWKIWRANRLDQAVSLAHREAMKFGNGFVLVDPFTTVNGLPRITVETPFQVAAYEDPSDRYVNAAATKTWQGPDGFYYSDLFTARWCIKYRSDKSYTDWTEQGLQIRSPQAEQVSWEQVDEFEHDLGMCPLVTIENNPTLTRGGTSDLELLLPLQRGIDNLARNLLIASEYAAFPQKYATGVTQPKDPQTGQPLSKDTVESSISRLWTFAPTDKDENPVSVGTFQPADLSNYVTGMEEIVHNMATVASVPGYRLQGQLANLSASAILAAEAGFIDACRVKQSDYGAGWSTTMTLALNAAGRKTTVDEVSVIWKDPSAVSGPNLAASLVPLQNVGVPQEALWKMLGASPEEIARWAAHNAANQPDQPVSPPATQTDVTEAVRQLTAHNAPNGVSTGQGMDPVPSSDPVPSGA